MVVGVGEDNNETKNSPWLPCCSQTSYIARQYIFRGQVRKNKQGKLTRKHNDDKEKEQLDREIGEKQELK